MATSVSLANYANYVQSLSAGTYDIKITGITEEDCKGVMTDYMQNVPYPYTPSNLETQLLAGVKTNVKINLFLDCAEYLIYYKNYYDAPWYMTFGNYISGIVSLNLSGSNYNYCSNLALCFPELKSINLTGCNNAVSINGIVCDNTQTTMLACPRAYEGAVELPSTITSLGYNRNGYINGMSVSMGVFESTPITAINLEETALVSIPAKAFYNCDSLISVTIPSTVTNIEEESFSECGLLDTVRVNGAPTLGIRTFKNSLVKTFIHNGITSIPQEAFAYSSLETFYNLNSVHVPGEVWIDSSITTIGKSAFFSCTSIRSVTIEGNPTLVEGTSGTEGIFALCSSLTQFNSLILENIPAYTFFNCTNLSALFLSPNIETVGTDAFDDCRSLYAVMYPNSVDSWCGITFTNENANPLNNGTCYLLAYEEFPEISPSEIPDYALKNAEITASSINAYAFYNYKTLETVDFSSNTIADSAFTGCTGITEITISGSPTDLSGRFKNLTSLETVYNMPPSVTNLTQAFSGCSSLTTIHNWQLDTTNATMTNCFANCSALTDIFVKYPVISDTYSTWHLIALNLTSTGCELTVYDVNLDANDNLVTQRTKSVTYSGSKILKLFNLVDELAGASEITTVNLYNLLKYKYQLGTSADGLDPSKKSFVIWASDENEVHSNIGNGILSLTDADFDQIF